MTSVADTGHARSRLTGLRTGPAHPAEAEFERLQWLRDGLHPLDWNGPTSRIFTRFRDEDLDRPIIVHFESVARRYPNRIAVTDSETSLSYSELWDGVSGLAEIIAVQTKPGDLIGIALPACSMFPLAILACLAAGRPFVALDSHYPATWLGQVLEHARPAMILKRENVCGAAAQPARKGWRPAALGVDEPACVLYTSGSSGQPKGIVNSQRNLLQRVAQSTNAAHINAEDRFLTLASLCTIVGVRDTITALLTGASVHLLDPQRTGAREILNIIRAEAITILFGFPALLRSVIADAGERADDALRLVRVGGDTTLWSDIDLLRGWLAPASAIQLIYAATEAPMMQWFVDDSCRTEEQRIPIGYPLPGNRLAVIDEDGRNTRSGEVGELIVGSPYVALGLLTENNADSSSRLFRTGDLVRQRSDGLLERMGRRDRQVKIRGTRVNLEAVEAALRRHPLVRDTGALARTSSDGGVTLVAYVCARNGASSGLLDNLKELMRSAPPSMRPGRFYLVHKIPRLPNFKMDVRALTALDESNVRNERADFARPAEGDHIVQTVAQIWQEILNTPFPGPEDNFFEVGGDSLKAIAFMNKIERALNRELSFTLINEAPQFAGFCQSLVKHRTGRYVPLVPLKAGDGFPPVFLIPSIGGNVAEFFPMARRMTWPGAIIGIQARGLAGKEPPHTSVEAMAAEHVRAMKARQPNGPYYLCGYSFGGLVAFEMARQLRESGDEMGLVGLFDTMLSPVRWPLRTWLSIARWRVAHFPALIRKLASRVREREPDRPPLPGFLKSAPTCILKVATSSLIASARYRPGFYPGELTLFSPVGREPGLPSLQSIWRKYARVLSVVETAGAHTTMVSAPHAESIATCLTQRLWSGATRTSLTSQTSLPTRPTRPNCPVTKLP